PPISGVGVAAPHGVAVTALAVDLLAPVLADRVVSDEQDRPLGKAVANEEPGQQGGQAQARPVGLRENLVVAGGGPVAEPADQAEQVADGAAAGAEEAGHGQQLGAGEDAGGEGGGEEGEDGDGVGAYTGHEGLLPARSRVAVQPPMLPPRRVVTATAF